jgi:flagellar hook-associated protein 3 FlgL
MTSIPSNLARVPDILASDIMAAALKRTQRSLLDTQIQLATGRIVNRPSDDPLATSIISVMDDVIERRDQRLRNLSHAEAVLNSVDAALADATDLVIEAKGIASSQIGVGSDADTRRNQAAVIDSLLSEMVAIANRQFQQIHFFGGSSTGRAPVSGLLSGYRYLGQGEGMGTDLGLAGVAITLSGEQAFGALSSRVEGNFDLDPAIVATTRLSDLNGARGLGVTLGEVAVDVGGTDVSVDLSTAHTVQDVIDLMEAAIQPIDAGFTMSIDVSGDGFALSPSAGTDVTVTDLTAGSTAADLGLDGLFPGGATTAGGDVDARITSATLVTSLGGLTLPLGTIRIENGGQTRDVDLSGVTTVEELANAVAGLDLGVRVEIAPTGDRLNFINELSGGRMSIGEVGGGTTATELGVRTLASWTRLADFNDGLGVSEASGSADPLENLDFRITLKDGSLLDVDLDGAATVQDVLDAINGAAGLAGVPIVAGLASDGNGITISDGSAGASDTIVSALNRSFAAEDLGLLGSVTGATMTGEDRARVAVDSVFSHLIDLRNALEADDERGITLASGRFDDDVSRLAEARAHVGVRSRRVADGLLREEDLRVQDMALRSQIQDLDYTEASLRFSTLQQQLQAGLLTARQVTSMTLLDFLA